MTEQPKNGTTFVIATADPTARAIFDELSVIARQHEDHTGELLTAVLQLAVSACKSFGVSPDDFVDNFRLFYDNSKCREVH